MYVVFNRLSSESMRTDSITSYTAEKFQSLRSTAFFNQTNTGLSGSDTVSPVKASATAASHLISSNDVKSKSLSINEMHTSDILIYGSVTDEHGQPIAGVLVKPDGKPNGVRSDSYGYFYVRVERVKNQYPILNFLKSGYKKKMIRVVKPGIDSLTALRADMQLSYSSETVTVHGWIGEANGKAIENEVIKLSSLADNLYYKARSNNSGYFTFEGIRRNVEYKVDVLPSVNYKQMTFESLTVTDHDIPLYINLEPLSLTQIEGVVVDSHGGVVEAMRFNLRSRINSTYDTALTTDEFGRFEVSEFPVGELSLTTKSPQFFKVTGIDLSQSIHTNLVIPVDIGPHQISGWVSDQQGLPLEGARVMLDAEFEFNGLNSSSIRTKLTDESGFFEFTRLGPGEHYVTVYAKGFINQGLSYVTGNRIDPVYLKLTQWSDRLIESSALK